MFQNLDVFRLSSAMAQHAAHRQALSAQNMAHADTPGYRARDLTPFRDHIRPGQQDTQLVATRPTHLNGVRQSDGFQPQVDDHSSGEPNENSVSLEAEMVRGVEIRRQHDRALAIYKSSMTILRTSLGRR